MKKTLTGLMMIIMASALLVGCGIKDGGTDNTGGTGVTIEGSLDTIMTDIQEQLGAEIMTFNEPVDLKDKDAVKYNLGLDDTQGIKEALASNAMISTHAYATVLVRTEAGADAKEIAKNMVAGVDLMKWICVGADDVQALVYGDIIYLVMLDSNLEEKDIQAHFDAFEAVSGSKADLIVKR